MTTQGENMDAIHAYMMEAPVHRPEAERLKNDFIAFWESLSTWQKHFDQVSYDLVRNLRNAFNRSNTATREEADEVAEQIKRGLSSEEIDGETDRRNSEGDYYIPPPSPPLFGGSAGGSTLLLGVALGLGLVVLLRR